jgi:hypothetical protein
LAVRWRRTLAAVILRILLIRPLLVLVRSLLVLNLRLLILVRPLLILIRPLLILVLALLVLVAAPLILAGRTLLPAGARLVLAETRPHGRSGAEFSWALRMQPGRGQAEKQGGSGGQTERQDRCGGRGRLTHSFRVPSPVHKSFSRQQANISKNQSPLSLLERDSIWSST